MFEKELQEIGLSKNESKLYLSLLELGSTTTGPLIKKSGLYRVIVYDILEKLIARGLVTYSVRKNRKQFVASSPKHLVEMVKHKEQIAQDVAAQLEKLSFQKPLVQGAYVYEGWNGVRAAQENYFTVMKKNAGGEYLMVGASRILHKRLDAFFNYFHERRSKLNVGAKLLFNENNRVYGDLKKQYRPVQVRFMPRSMVTPSWISTYADMVLIGVAEDSPMAFFVKNQAVAQSYQQYFSFMWKKSKE